MSSDNKMPKPMKGEVRLYGYYDGTPMVLFTSKEEYPSIASAIKEQGRAQVKKMLEGVWKTKEKVVDALVEQMNRWHQAILNISNVVSKEVLEEAWGKDYENTVILWMVNISSLLYLKHIKNDDNNGWLVEDHNSCQWSTAGGKHAYVHGNNVEKIFKKVSKVIKNI
jgi:hypothetical protein